MTVTDESETARRTCCRLIYDYDGRGSWWCYADSASAALFTTYVHPWWSDKIHMPETSVNYTRPGPQRHLQVFGFQQNLSADSDPQFQDTRRCF